MNARDLSNRLADLLRREHGAFADFLLALADFDRRRAYEQLGHATLFAFLHRELGLSKGSAYYRKVAAELVQRFPEVIEPLRDGRLCVTSVVELSKVLTPENRDEVLPRFFHRSKHEARAITAELRPQEAPARRDVVTAARAPATARAANTARADSLFDVTPPRGGEHTARPPLTATTATNAATATPVQPVEPRHANSVESSWAAPLPPASPRDAAEPLTADLRRLHVTVSRRFLAKLDAARDALSHAKPGATTEEILEAALDLLLEKTTRRRAGAVKKPRAVAAAQRQSPRAATAPQKPAPCPAPEPSTAPAAPNPRHVPAAVRREVWTRDQGRCTWPRAGGICGSTHRLELDHVTPVALGGPSTVANLRVLCDLHNRLAARQALGDACVDRYARRRPPSASTDGAMRCEMIHAP